MVVSADEQVAHLRAQLDQMATQTANNIQPVETTPSGVVPGNAPLDPPHPDAPPAPPLNRSNRSRKPTDHSEAYTKKRQADWAKADKAARTRELNRSRSAHSGTQSEVEPNDEPMPLNEHSQEAQPVVASGLAPAPQPVPLEPESQPPLEPELPLNPESLPPLFNRNSVLNTFNLLGHDLSHLSNYKLYREFVDFCEDNKTALGRIMADTENFTAEDVERALLSQPVPDFHGLNISNHWAQGTPSNPATPPSSNPVPAPAPAQLLAHANSGHDTATQDSAEDNNDGPPPIKRSRTQRRRTTVLSPPNPDTATEPESDEPLESLPPKLQLRYPSRAVSKPHAPSHRSAEDSEVVPETDPEILAERVPRYAPTPGQPSTAASSRPSTTKRRPSTTTTSQPSAPAPSQPRTYGSVRSYVGSGNPPQPPSDHKHTSSWRESVQDHANRHPLPLPSARSFPRTCGGNDPAPHHQPGLSQPNSSQPNPSQPGSTKRRSAVAAKRQAAKQQLDQMANPPTPEADGRRDMLNNAHARLKSMAKAIVGRQEPTTKKTRPLKLDRAGPSAHRASRILAQTDDTDEEADDEEEEEDKEGEEEDRAEAAHGEAILTRCGRKPKPRTTQLQGYARQVIIIAKLLLWVYALIYGAYLDRKTYLLWSVLVYEIAWYYVYPNMHFQRPSEIAYPIMVNNLSTMKCNTKIAVRSVVEWWFQLIKPALTQADIDHNLDILRYIYPLRFHCTNPRRRSGHFQSIIIPRAIAAALFYGENSVGVLFHEYFDPMPIPTIAFILTTIQFCLGEWADSPTRGVFHPRKLSELGPRTIVNMYLSHMENIRRFRASGHSNLSDLRGEWFRYALVYSSASIRDDDCDLENLIDMDEFGPAPGPSRLTSNPSQLTSRQSQQPSRKRQRNPSTDRSSEAGPSTQRLRHDEPSDDENVAINMQMAYYEADAEEYSNGEPMDVDTQPEREGSYEFPNPTPQPPTPSDANQEPHFTAEQKGKGRVD